MTPAEAQAIQDEADRQNAYVLWFISADGNRFVATAKQADGSGGHEVGQMSADTLVELQAMLPTDLVRFDAGTFDPAGTIESWERPDPPANAGA